MTTYRISSILRGTLSEIEAHLTFDCVQESTSKDYSAQEKSEEIPHVRNTSHGTVNTKIATKRFRKYFYVLPLLKMPLPAKMYEAPAGGLKA
jgi:hypothetical protein